MVGTRGQARRVAGVLAAAGMVLAAAACGGDDDSTGDTTTPTVSAVTTTAGASTPAGSTPTGSVTNTAVTTTAGDATGEWVATVAGCETSGVTDPADRSAAREVARCDPHTPAPQPLPERVQLTVSSSASLEFMSPVLLAQSLGEFEAENLEVEVVSVSFADAVPQLAQGAIDAAVGGIDLSLFNMGNQGLPVRAVLGNYYPPFAGDYDVAQTGLWCRRDAFTDPADPDPLETEQMVWASSVGKGAGSIYYATVELQKRAPEFDITDVEVQQIPAAEVLTAMQNDAVDCGILVSRSSR